jgi:hypothetical protein
MSAWPDTRVARATQEMFLGRLTIEESHAALERLVRHVMIKAVFMSAVVDAPDPAELAMWLAWSAPLLIHRKLCYVLMHVAWSGGLARLALAHSLLPDPPALSTCLDTPPAVQGMST